MFFTRTIFLWGLTLNSNLAVKEILLAIRDTHIHISLHGNRKVVI